MDSFECDKCGKTLDIEDVYYLGPEDEEEVCHPFQEFICICNSCGS